MNKADIITHVAAIPERDPRLEQIAAVIQGKPNAGRPPSLRLYRPGEVCKKVGISPATLWRLERENKISSIVLRRGSKRYPEAEVLRLVGGDK